MTRNKAVNNWIRENRTTQTLPLDLDALSLGAGDEGDAPLPSSGLAPRRVASIDAGAGTGGSRTAPEPSMNDLLRGAVREGKLR